jgi:LysR family transcriptional regulator, transcriptional activator for leuABCD operon
MFNLRRLDLNLLTVFEAIHEIGSVSGAADRLALSQSAASHALARLRDACKDDLFVRARQGLSPTPAAQEMYPAIKQALEALRATLAEASGFDPGTSQRRFRISIPHPMGPFYALALQATASTIAPGVSLTFDTTSRPANLEDGLRDGIVDIAIDWLPVELDPFVNAKLFDDQFVLIARSDHPLVEVTVTLDDLRRARFVSLHHRRAIERLPPPLREGYRRFQEHGINPGFLVSELLEIPTVVASTDLLGPVLSSMIPLLEKQLGLQALASPLELASVPIYMIWHETRRHDAAHRWLREAVAQELRRLAPS